MYDFSDVEPQQSSDLIADGSFAKVIMTIRPGGVDGQTEIDRGLLKASTTAGSDVLSLDCELTVTEGRLARRKFWQTFTVSGGKVDEKGASIGWNISKRTRIQLNMGMKRAAGFDTVYPSGEHRNGHIEKIICLKNRHDLGIVNGMFLELSDVRDENEIGFSATIRTEDGDPVGGTDSNMARYVIYKGHFDDHVQRDPERESRDHWVKKGLIEAVWGYAITCHKAQGSQYPTVVVYDDGLGRTAEDRSRWLYTAITRAEWGLVILD